MHDFEDLGRIVNKQKLLDYIRELPDDAQGIILLTGSEDDITDWHKFREIGSIDLAGVNLLIDRFKTFILRG